MYIQTRAEERRNGRQRHFEIEVAKQSIIVESCRVARRLGLGASTHEVVKCETQGGESEPLNPGMGGPLDQNSEEISYTRSSGVRRLEGATFDRRSREVPRV
jgi:hypothetical protein